MSNFEETFLNGKFLNGLGGELCLVGEEVVYFVLGISDNFVYVFASVFGGVSDGGSDGAGDLRLEFLFLLNFVAIISNLIIKKEYLVL